MEGNTLFNDKVCVCRCVRRSLSDVRDDLRREQFASVRRGHELVQLDRHVHCCDPAKAQTRARLCQPLAARARYLVGKYLSFAGADDGEYLLSGELVFVSVEGVEVGEDEAGGEVE